MEHKLFLCLEKCEFHRKQIEYLELVISENKVAMDPVKVTGVHKWPIPENRTDVQAFIGFVNFYCYYPEKKNGIQWLSIANPCLRWNGTTRSMTKRCSLSSGRWKSGGTF